MSESQQADVGPSLPAVQGIFNVPTFYMNGFNNTASFTDVTTMALWNNKPQALISIPLSLAKSYALNILELIEFVERQSGQKILTMQEMEAAAKQAAPEQQR